RWPGRLELLTVGGHDVLLDGAHNPAGAAALASALDDLRPFLSEKDLAAPVTLVVGAMADKDVAGIAKALAGAAALRGARIIATRVDLPRALPAEDLAAVWRGFAEVDRIEAIADVGRALDSAIARAPGPVVVAGSLYLVGEARRRWVDDPAVTDPEVRLDPDPAKRVAASSR